MAALQPIYRRIVAFRRRNDNTPGSVFMRTAWRSSCLLQILGNLHAISARWDAMEGNTGLYIVKCTCEKKKYG